MVWSKEWGISAADGTNFDRGRVTADLGALVQRVEPEKVTTRPEPKLHTTTGKPAAA